MLKNYLKIALRNMRQHPGYTFINAAGLAVGLACCILIFLFVRDELRYDRFHEKADRIYRIVHKQHGEEEVTDATATPPALAPAVEQAFPEVQQATRIFKLGRGPLRVRHGEQDFFEADFLLADPEVFQVFTLPLMRGDTATALSAPDQLILAERAARKYFGDEDPIGQTLDVGGIDFTVTGVLADPPEQSHLDFDFLGSLSTLGRFADEERMSSWTWQQFFTYVLLPEGNDASRFEAKLSAFVDERATPQTSAHGYHYEAYLQPLADIYLRPIRTTFEIAETGNVTYVYAFSGIAILILLIACFNFMNLATARSMLRAKEVGMRKVVGARRGQLVRQFLGEATLLALAALAVAGALASAVLPSFRDFTGKALELDLVGDGALLAALVAATVFAGLLAGSYPALYLSRLQPLRSLKGAGGTAGGEAVWLRKSLVVFQFAISILLLVSTVVVFRQLDYLRNTSLGFDEEQVVVLPMRGDIEPNYETVKDELLRIPSVTSVAGSYGVPGGAFAVDGVRLPGRDAEWSTPMFLVDPDYVETYGINVVAGRDFSQDRPAEARRDFVINQTAARELGWSPEEAIGKEMTWDVWGTGSLKQGAVIGVVEDFHIRSLHHAVEPLVLQVQPSFFSDLSVRIHPDDAAGTLRALEAVWAQWAPDWPFTYEFLDQELDNQYRAEEKLSQLAAVFSLLAILVGCLGLFGLAAHMAERRTKEMGVRKVLGASVAGLVALLSKDFLKLVLIGFAIAAPIAYYAMHRWLAVFPYRVEIGWWTFVLAGCTALLIALLTVSYQAIHAALADPVESLRYE